MADLPAAVQARHLARLISAHHQSCRRCQRRAGGRGLRCRAERALFARLRWAAELAKGE